METKNNENIKLSRTINRNLFLFDNSAKRINEKGIT